MAAQDQGAMVEFGIGPFLLPLSLPVSEFQSLDPRPRFLGPYHTGLVKCPELDLQKWWMFVSWVYSRDYEVLYEEPTLLPMTAIQPVARLPQSLYVIAVDLRKPTSRLCTACFGLVRAMDDGFRPCDYCKVPTQLLRCREQDCLQANRPICCFRCTNLGVPRVGALSYRAKKVMSFAKGGWGFPGLPQHLGLFNVLVATAEPATTVPLRPWCHARRLDVQFQLYYFAQTHGLIEFQKLIRFKVWHTLMHLVPHPQTNTSLAMSLLTAISKLPLKDQLRYLLIQYWACVREEMKLTAPGYEQLAPNQVERTRYMDEVEKMLADGTN